MIAAMTLDWYSATVRERLFRAAADTRRIGAEIELLPLLADTGAVCPLRQPLPGDDRSTLVFVRTFGASRGWSELRSPKGAPYFALRSGETLTFEPGGQLELSSPPFDSASELIAHVRDVLEPLHSAAADAGIELASVGIDPWNDVLAAPLQLDSDRYRRMTTYFERRGGNGVRMMRQTAATQISVDTGTDPCARWRLLCDLAPFLTAIFANSSRYAGNETGYRSFRAHCWRTLDPSRTGIPYPDIEAPEAYTRFALEATDMMRTDRDGAYQSFGDWVAAGDASDAQWENHLTTLFPEVRPRGHLEVRSIDALPLYALAAPIVMLAGLTYHEPTAHEARDLLPAADEALLIRAARCGLRDEELDTQAQSLVTLALRGARALGTSYLATRDIDAAEAFFDRFTRRGHSPADER